MTVGLAHALYTMIASYEIFVWWISDNISEIEDCQIRRLNTIRLGGSLNYDCSMKSIIVFRLRG